MTTAEIARLVENTDGIEIRLHVGCGGWQVLKDGEVSGNGIYLDFGYACDWAARLMGWK